MRRYIDVTDITKQISDFKRAVNSPNSDYMTGYLSALSVTEGMIANTPTADVVEVVRCKDCFYSHFNTSSERYSCQREYPRRSVEEDDYCRYGRRREE